MAEQDTNQSAERAGPDAGDNGLAIDGQHHALVQGLVDSGVFPDALTCLRFAIGLGVHRGKRRAADGSETLMFSGSLEGTHGAIAASEAGDIGALVPDKAGARRKLTAQFANAGLDVLSAAKLETPEDLISLYQQEMS